MIKAMALILFLSVIIGTDITPVFAEEWTQENKHSDLSFAKKLSTDFLKFYKKFLSPVNGERCRMEPSCSEYATQAVRKHGAIMGLILATDRLMREGEEIHRGLPKITPSGIRYPDTLKSNDFWMGGESP